MNQQEMLNSMEKYLAMLVQTQGLKKTQEYCVNEVEDFFKDNPIAESLATQAAIELVKVFELNDLVFRFLITRKHKHIFTNSCRGAIGAILVQWLKIKDYPKE